MHRDMARGFRVTDGPSGRRSRRSHNKNFRAKPQKTDHIRIESQIRDPKPNNSKDPGKGDLEKTSIVLPCHRFMQLTTINGITLTNHKEAIIESNRLPLSQ